MTVLGPVITLTFFCLPNQVELLEPSIKAGFHSIMWFFYVFFQICRSPYGSAEIRNQQSIPITATPVFMIGFAISLKSLL